MKPAITFFLSLCFLLCGGYNHLFAYSHQPDNSLSRHNVIVASKKASTGFSENTPATIRKATSSATDNGAIDAEEIDDDDEFHFSRKQVAIINFFLSYFSAQAGDDVHYNLNNRLPVCAHFSYTASSKYIVQRVIRI